MWLTKSTPSMTSRNSRRHLAERAGFEPAVPFSTPDFESGTFDHSATSPSQ